MVISADLTQSSVIDQGIHGFLNDLSVTPFLVVVTEIALKSLEIQDFT